MKVLSTIIQWIILIAIIIALWYLFRYKPIHITGDMTGFQCVLFSVSFSFLFTELFKLTFKPLNCLKCMTGWVALILAFIFNVPFWPFYLFVGAFTGAIIELVIMRWL